MHLLVTLVLLSVSCVLCKNNVKSLTESMGQEVIEIGAPLKELPPDIEEEPSAENDDDDATSTAVTQLVTAKKDLKKTTTVELLMTQKKDKDINKIDGVTLDDEEARIEKELAEIYKDNIEDYKADSSEKEITANITKVEEIVENKPIGRSKENFQFEPNTNNKAAIEKFRTSIDELSCKRRLSVDKTTTPKPNSACPAYINAVFLVISLFTYMFA